MKERAFLVFAGLAFLLVGAFSWSRLRQQPVPAAIRYQLVAARVLGEKNVANQNEDIPQLFRIDTQTGDVWVYDSGRTSDESISLQPPMFVPVKVNPNNRQVLERLAGAAAPEH